MLDQTSQNIIFSCLTMLSLPSTRTTETPKNNGKNNSNNTTIDEEGSDIPSSAAIPVESKPTKPEIHRTTHDEKEQAKSDHNDLNDMANAPRPPELWLINATQNDESSKDASNHDSNPENRIRISSLQELKMAISLLDEHEKMSINHDDASSSTDHDGTMNRQHTMETNFSTRTNTTPEAFLDEVKRFELFRSVIQHEDDLLNQRVSWIILAQSFLMAAYITAGGSEEDGTNALKYITAIVGLLTVVVTMPAILAAGRNIELQQHVYFSRISSEERCRELHGHGRKFSSNSDEVPSMDEEQRERMRSGHIFPNMAFRGKGSLPILFTVVALAIVQVGGWCFLLMALLMGW